MFRIYGPKFDPKIGNPFVTLTVTTTKTTNTKSKNNNMNEALKTY